MILFKGHIHNKESKIKAEKEITHLFTNIIEDAFKYRKDIVFVNIGTQKVLFDSFGPILGSAIKDRLMHMPNIKVYGEVGDNIIATNVEEKINYIKEVEQDNVIIAVDAAVCTKKEDIGLLQFCRESIKPGAGANKDLGEIGEFSISLSTCLATKSEDESYNIDLKSSIKDTDLYENVEILISSLYKACDIVIENIFKKYIA